MEPTTSYQDALPSSLLHRYDFLETRNACRILTATNPVEAADLQAVLANFRVHVDQDIFPAGGNESLTASRLNRAFRDRGWREAAYSVSIRSELILGGGDAPLETAHESEAASYKIDNVKGRVALDVEWHAKDGNLDRDIAAYRMLYDSGIIDAAVMITMTRLSMRAWVQELDPASRKFSTSTTTNLEKVTPKLIRGDAGGCPVLVISVNRKTV